MTDSAERAGYPAVQDYLFSLKAQGPRFGIDRMRLLAREIGHPERAVPCVHVAGTNGKGSVCAMLESVFRAAGWRTGLYTSPHLVRLGERVQVNRIPLGEAEIMAYVAELAPAAEALQRREGIDGRPSFFEFMTAMAFLQFARRRCDISVIEVGLGGRLDATNIVEPELCVITSIGLDHCEMLGDTIEKIAAEKAGILKPGKPVVIGRLPPGAEAVVRGVAARLGCPVSSVTERFGPELTGYPETNCEGDHQRWNAGAAALAAEVMGSRWRLSPGIIGSGLSRVDWPARWQRLRLGGRLVILDASHNPEGAAALQGCLARLRRETGRAPVVVTGVLGTARARPLLEVIARHAREIHLVVPRQDRACGFEQLESLIPPAFEGRVVRGTVEGIFPGPGACAAGDPADPLVVTGSVYLAGEVLARLEPQRGPGEGRLQDF
jgi:dihydrofolate synthase / folylpolyglutamate synthase